MEYELLQKWMEERYGGTNGEANLNVKAEFERRVKIFLAMELLKENIPFENVLQITELSKADLQEILGKD